jgi:plasmid stabilization system protein ParE
MKKAHARQRHETLARLRNRPVEELEREEELCALEEAEKQRLERIARHAAWSFSASATDSMVDRILNEVSVAVKDAIGRAGVPTARVDAHSIAETVARRLAQVLSVTAPAAAALTQPATPKIPEAPVRIPILDIERIVDFLLEKEATAKKWPVR